MIKQANYVKIVKYNENSGWTSKKFEKFGIVIHTQDFPIELATNISDEDKAKEAAQTYANALDMEVYYEGDTE